MQSIIVLLSLLFASAALGFDLAAYKQQYHTQVAAPYRNAVTVAAVNIMEYLANSPVPQSQAASQAVVQQMKAQTQQLANHLNAATTASDGLRQQVDREVEQLTARAGAVEQQINANQQQMAQVNVQIVQTDAQLVAAQNQVNQAAQSAQHAESVLRDEEERLRKSREGCIGKRKKRGWLSGITKPFRQAVRVITKPIERAVCAVVNSGGIDRAKDAVNRAKADRNGAQQRLAQFQQQRAQLAAQHAQLQQSRAHLEGQKAQLQVALAQLQQARVNANTVNVHLKNVVAHLTTLLGKTQVLKDVVKDLIDMETVITPLHAIADQVITYSGHPDDANYLNAMKAKISASLPVIRQKLPQYALIV